MIKLHVFIYIANLDCHDLNVSALAALAPPIIIMVGHIILVATNSIHRRRNQGGRGGDGPPRFQNIYFRPPQISKPKINQYWLEITFKYVSSVT